jgi:hypothetical protein
MTAARPAWTYDIDVYDDASHLVTSFWADDVDDLPARFEAAGTTYRAVTYIGPYLKETGRLGYHVIAETTD